MGRLRRRAVKSKISRSPSTVARTARRRSLHRTRSTSRRGTRRPRALSMRRRSSASLRSRDRAGLRRRSRRRPPLDDLDEPLVGEVAAGDEAAQVHLDELRQAHVVAEDRRRCRCLHRRRGTAAPAGTGSLLVALGGRRRQRAHHHAADVHEVRRVRRPTRRCGRRRRSAAGPSRLGGAARRRCAGRWPGTRRRAGWCRRGARSWTAPRAWPRRSGTACGRAPMMRPPVGVEQRDRVVLRLGHHRADRGAVDGRGRLVAIASSRCAAPRG